MLAPLVAVLLIGTACGADDTSDTTAVTTTTAPTTATTATTAPTTTTAAAPTTEAEADLSAMLPDAIREAGVIKSGGPVSIPPKVFLEEDGATRTGFMTDLAEAVAAELGVELEYAEMPFPALIPGLQGGSLDMTMTVSDQPARQEILDFVDFLDDGLVILVPAGNPNAVDSLESLCGLTVAVLSGSIANDLVQQTSESCGDPIEIKEFPGAADAQLAVRSGQADATFGGHVALNYLAATAEDGNAYEVAPGGPYTSQPDAFGFLKGNDQLRDAVQAALQRLVDNGTYEAILSQYGVTDGLYEEIPINAAGQ